MGLLDAHDLPHVLLAAEHALTLARHYPAAIRHLDDSAYRWSELIPELCDLRRRWLARALIGCERPDKAAAHRSALRTPWVRELVALDELVEAAAPCDREPDTPMLTAKYGGLVDLVRASVHAGTPSPARWLADRFPY